MSKKQDVFTIKNGRVVMSGDGYRTSADAVVLARVAVRESKNAKSALDVGVGAGGVILSMLDDMPKLSAVGIDISDAMLKQARTNADLNKRPLELIKADIFNWKTNRLFDVVVTNPPYFSGTPRSDNAHHNADIYKWVVFAVKRLRARGRFFAIVAPDVMDRVIAALYVSKLGEVRVTPVVSKHIERVVISARRGVKTGAKITPSEFY